MKKPVLTFLMICSITFLCKAQNPGKLWGMTNMGGANGSGVLFTFDETNLKDSVALSFMSSPGSDAQYGKLLLANDGNYYGMTLRSLFGDGILFKCTPSGDIAVLANFEGYQADPYGSVIQANDGNLYGMTQLGGNSFGVIFKYDLTSQTLSTIYKFDNFSGDKPRGSLIQSTDGYLYGMTNEGVTGSVIFKCSLDGTSYSVLHTFTNNESPYGSLILGSDGNFYGMTYGGGANGKGTIFKCSTDGTTFNTLVDFSGTDGAYPYGSLLEATDGNLYGMTSAGGTSDKGTVFTCTTSGTLNTLVNFDGSTNGASPFGDLFQHTDGNLYGMTSAGGSSDNGTIFKCTTSGTLTTLVNFSNGEHPQGSLIQNPTGELIGMTNAGGKLNNGLIFKCTTSGVLTTINDFGVTKLGGSPGGNVIQARDGNLLYGMTSQGGSWNGGTIFKYNISNGQADTLVSFNDVSGKEPFGSLIELQDGNLYGMTNAGGSLDSGTVFKCSPQGAITVLANLSTKLGGHPEGGFVQAGDGNLYGMTYDGGAYGFGTIIKYDTTSHLVDTLLSFDGIKGNSPYGDLIVGKDGFLYGMTNAGGTINNGNIFKCSTAGTITSLYEFGSNDMVFGSLVQGMDGNLYGLSYSGGANNGGYIFKCTTSGSFTSLYDLPGGYYPYGNLIIGTDSNFYGMSTGGGTSGLGTIFKYTSGGAFSVLVNFNNDNGNNGLGSLLEALDLSISKTFDCVNATTLKGEVRGGHPPYTYKWSDNTSASTITDITAGGIYTLKVTDSKGVSLTASVNVASSQVPDVGTTLNATSIQSNATGATYQWLDCTNGYSIIAGETSQIFSPAASGNYAVEVTAYGCTDTSTCVNLSLTAILQSNGSEAIRISPNPTSGVLMLKAEQNIQQITVTDLAGETIIDMIPDAGVLSLNMESYPNGMYLLHLKMDDKIQTTKFVLQK